MGAPIKKITIVGGGTAGWLTAVLLHTSLETDQAKDNAVEITLVESPDIPTVGVGEATVPNMPRTLRQAGISEQQFFNECNASFKLGVLFGHWNVDNDGKPIEYINPFSQPIAIKGFSAAHYFKRYGAADKDIIETYSPAPALYRAARGPRPLGTKPFDRGVGYAYHLDAGKFAKLLQRECVKRGVKHIRENVRKIEQDEQGFITALELQESGRHELDLVIDCTGFKGMIINQTLKEPFIDYGKYLANNKAIAVQIKHPDPNRIDSVTKSTALGAGWIWRVPLFNRIGTGYVFSGNHRTDDEAMDEFKAHLGDQLGDAEPRIIPMRVGRTERAWVKNCIAVGLSSGFIEPLESTAIHMIDMSVRWLAVNFPTKDFEPALVDRYNNLLDGLYNEVLDFICIHYRLGNRTDSQYWIDTREELKIPDRLAENLEVWKHRLPQIFDLSTVTLFDVHTYNAVLLGKRVYETGWGSKDFEVGVNLDEPTYRAYLAQADKDINNIVAKMPDHMTLLKELRGEMAKPSHVILSPLTQYGAMGVLGMPPSAAPAPKSAPVEAADDDLNLL